MFSYFFLPTSLPATTYILNLDSHDRPGSHWVSREKRNYFDSLNFKSREEPILSNILSPLNKPIVTNTFRVQDYLSSVCGIYCIYY